MRALDVTGQRFGHLVALEAAAPRILPSGQPETRWRFRCDCGSAVERSLSNVRAGRTRSCGCARRAHPIITYIGAHARVRRARGSARNHLCVDCGERADEWSYDGGSPVEIRGLVPTSKGGKTYVRSMAWSPDPADYSPRCRADHREHDGRAA